MAEVVLILCSSLVRLRPVLRRKEVDKLKRIQRKAMRVIKGLDWLKMKRTEATYHREGQEITDHGL